MGISELHEALYRAAYLSDDDNDHATRRELVQQASDHMADLEAAWRTIDMLLWDGALAAYVDAAGIDLTVRYSAQLTSSGGNCRTYGRGIGVRKVDIKLSSAVLHANYQMVRHDGAQVGGVPAPNRWDAALLTLEHELIHAVVGILWADAPAHGAEFMALLWRAGQSKATHGMVIPRVAERVAASRPRPRPMPAA